MLTMGVGRKKNYENDFYLFSVTEKEEMVERFKAADCKSVEINLIVGSNPALFNLNT